MKQNAFDTANGVLAVSYIAAFFSGWTVADWSALVALLYGLFLLTEKAISMTARFMAWRGRRCGK